MMSAAKTVEIKENVLLNAWKCCFQAYLDELVELHKRLMTLREGHILQQVSFCWVTVQKITILEENCRLMLYCWMKMKLKGKNC